MHYEFKARAERAPHSLEAPLCRARTGPPLGHDEVCGTNKFLTQPPQSVWRFKGIIPYRRRILSWNPSHENSVLLRRYIIDIRNAPFSVARWRRFIIAPSASSFLPSHQRGLLRKIPLILPVSARPTYTLFICYKVEVGTY